jgi:hypothetical protein
MAESNAPRVFRAGGDWFVDVTLDEPLAEGEFIAITVRSMLGPQPTFEGQRNTPVSDNVVRVEGRLPANAPPGPYQVYMAVRRGRVDRGPGQGALNVAALADQAFTVEESGPG